MLIVCVLKQVLGKSRFDSIGMRSEVQPAKTAKIHLLLTMTGGTRCLLG
jgi:hypothetical protein